MAKFKLYLMSLRGAESEFSPRYSLMPISEFNTKYDGYDGLQLLKDQTIDWTTYDNNRGSLTNSWGFTKTATANFIQDQSFTYTSNEKFQIHQNSQRSLSFTMCRNIIRADRIEVNPFINYLFIGAQLLLIDKYDKHHLMTVSKISYKFNELNTEFMYECQDSFSYQLSRQNAGYEITNNYEDDSNDFIGAQELDWWVLCKIHPECKISYQYLKLNDKRSFKQSYDGDQYKDYHRTVPFSGSGTANSVLIALGELYGLQLNVYEHVDLQYNSNTYGQCEKYYWFSPTKSLQPTGLKYSPYGDLQSFTLEHSGNSFASILNIQSHTIGDEIITAIPPVPNFFRQWFETEEWRNSSFYVGLFSSACQEYVDYVLFDGVSVDVNQTFYNFTTYYRNNTIAYQDGLLYIPIRPKTWYTRYDLMQFSTNGGTHSKITIATDEDSIAFNSKYNSWKMIYKLSGGVEQEVWSKESIIPYDKINQNGLEYFFLVFDIGINHKAITVMGDLYISQYRIPTTEELEFAIIADKIPWLENKLISFDYFYNHSIINASEYTELMQLLQNNLRKVNAKLLYYSQEYYKAIQSKTIILGDLSAKLDLVGATFQTDVINPYLEDGRVTKTTDFVLAMSDLWSNSKQEVPLLNYYETLTDYVNKYYQAEQTFLKNMYLFNDYFNSKTNFGTLYTYTFTLPNQDGKTQISFTTPNQYVSLNEKNQHYPIYEKVADGYQLYNRNNIVDDNNISRFCYLDPYATGMTEITVTTPQYIGFNEDQQYFELSWKVQILEGWPKIEGTTVDRSIVIANVGVNKFEIELLSTDEEDNKYAILSCYMDCLHTTALPKNSKLILSYEENEQNKEITVQVISDYYKPVDYTALRNNFFYQQLHLDKENRQLKHLYRKKTGANEMLCPIKCDSEQPLRYNYSWAEDFKELGLNPQILLCSPDSKNWDSEHIDIIKTKTLENYNKSTEEICDEVEDAYKEYFPITTLYWYGKETEKTDETYHAVPFVNRENCIQFYRRVSVSNENRIKWWVADQLIAPFGLAIWAEVYWCNGEKDFGNEGWTYHDIFNCPYEPCFGDNWSKTTRLMYISNPKDYDKTAQRDVFPEACFNSSSGYWHILNEFGQQGAACARLEDETNDKTQVVQWGYNEATTMLLTYYSFNRRLRDQDKEKYHYKTKYWRLLTKDSYISKNDSLQIILAPSENPYVKLSELKCDEIPLKSKNKDITHKRISSVVYYPLNHVLVTQSVSELKWPENNLNNYITLGELIDNNMQSDDAQWDKNNNMQWSGSIKTSKEKTISGTMIFVKSEDFNYEDITNLKWGGEEVNYESIWEYASSNYYDSVTDQPINLITSYPDMTIGFYVAENKDEDYLPATNVDNSLIYYEKLYGDYHQRYTMQQLIDKKRFYVKLQDFYEYSVFGTIDSLNVNYFIYEIDDNQNIISTKEEMGIITLGENKKGTLAGPSLKININYDYKSENLNNCTNGWFWYQYKNNLKSTILMEKAMLIETNLTEYWTNAYYASKNCKYFLPEYWQLTVNQKTNYFSGNILSVVRDGDSDKGYTAIDIKLSSKYIPDVVKIANQPRYQLRHVNIAESLATTRALQYGLNIGDTVMLSSVKTTPIQDMMNYLQLPVEQWMVTKLSYGDEVIYQHNGGGTLWTDALVTLTNSALQYDQFGGWYDMMIRVLHTCNYRNYNPVQYRQAQEEHDAIWRQIYTKYPNLIYEQAYTNEDATTPQELLTMAQWAFKDYNQPESNYNISVIDSNTLKGYKGQELAIGDGIEVNATELYDDVGSDIYKSLIQYLYITDISYDLRQDDSIQLTVNSIKYRDKVIGELVKLIR